MCAVQKNDSEKELLKLQRVHQQQQEDLQSCLAKTATLEATLRQQEKVNRQLQCPLYTYWYTYLISQQGALLSMNSSLKRIFQHNILYACAVPIFQVIEKMEKALDGKLREKKHQSGDKRPAVKKQRGRSGLSEVRE